MPEPCQSDAQGLLILKRDTVMF